MAAALLAGYLMGSLPFAFWFAALQGKAWSGREPLWRLGPVPAGLVLLLDFAKGVFAVALGEFLARDYTGGLAAGAAAAFAHALSPWLGLRRAGSLLAPLGVLFAVDPRLLLLAGLPAGVLLLAGRKAHPALLAFALALPLPALLLGGGQAHLLFALALSLALLWPPR